MGSIFNNAGYIGYEQSYNPEDGLVLTNSFAQSTNIANSSFDRSSNVTFACDITFPNVFNSEGTIFELGRTGSGCGIGLINSGETLRFLASDGANPPNTSTTAILDIDTDIFNASSSGTLVWDFQINPGRVRAWWNNSFLGEAFTSGSGPMENSVWAGTAGGSYILATSDNGPGGTSNLAWPGTAQSNLRYYSNQLVSRFELKGIFNLKAIFDREP
jgi:hypothetical protein